MTPPDGHVGPVLGLGEDRAWAAFAAAWSPLQAPLFRTALLIAHHRPDAEDAVADAMIDTFGPWRAGRVESLEAYARRAVVNRLVGRGRRRAVAERFLALRRSDPAGGRDDAADVAARDEVRTALRALAPRQRAIVVLRYYAELSVAETAQALGCSTGTVKSQCHDALATLRRHLDRDEEPGR